MSELESLFDMDARKWRGVVRRTEEMMDLPAQEERRSIRLADCEKEEEVLLHGGQWNPLCRVGQSEEQLG